MDLHVTIPPISAPRNQKVLQLLKDHILYVTSRVNSITGVTYKDDPAIIGYNLFNEPR
jgi:mannan endo-1,4-beta-mannosidase